VLTVELSPSKSLFSALVETAFEISPTVTLSPLKESIVVYNSAASSYVIKSAISSLST
jgi:hypothetical protein